MTSQPGVSLPNRHASWGDVKAAYRFFNNPKVTPEALQRTHRQRVREACTRHQIVLAVEDGSELDYTAHPAVEGLGFVGGKTGRGLLQHSTLAVTTDGKLLGVLHQIWWKRTPTPEGETRRQRQARPCESGLWAESIRAVGTIGLQTRVIHVMDRGADCYETMYAAEQTGSGFLLRARHDRYVNDSTEPLWALLQRQPVAGSREVCVPPRPAKASRPARPARIAHLTVRYAPVQIPPPRNDPRFIKPLSAWAVHVVEENAPSGVEPVEWMLLTSENINSLETAQTCVDWYTLRWIIEEWHKVEKTGCRLEASQLKTADALERLAALTAVVAVRLIQLRDLAQQADAQSVKKENDWSPDRVKEASAALRAVAPRDWITVVAILAKCHTDALSPGRFWLTIARQGGFLARTGDGQPGWQTIWKGWSKVMTLVQGFEMHRTLETCG